MELRTPKQLNLSKMKSSKKEIYLIHDSRWKGKVSKRLLCAQYRKIGKLRFLLKPTADLGIATCLRSLNPRKHEASERLATCGEK